MRKITKLSIFDFDGTLISTPLPIDGKLTYLEKKGESWPHRGWWGQGLSLDMDIFEMPVIEDVIASYEKEKLNSNTGLIVLTGRLEGLRTEVKAILDAKGLEFDEIHLNTGGRTENVKMRTISKLLKKFPEVTQVEAWDDRIEHIPIFEKFGEDLVKSGRLVSFIMNIVPADRH